MTNPDSCGALRINRYHRGLGCCMRPLLVSDDIRQMAKQIVEHSKKPENWFKPDSYQPILPGDQAEHVLVIPFGFRCVFSWTQIEDGTIYKHLSISVPGGWPNQFACYEIAELFEFSKRENIGEAHPKWMLDVNQNDRCIIMLEAVEG